MGNIFANKMFSISQSATADSSLYQREPCHSFSLKYWFATKQVYQREPWSVDCLYRITATNKYLWVSINLGSTVQGELAALAVWGVVKQPVYIKFRLQITTQKSVALSPLYPRGMTCKGRWFFLRKTGGIDIDAIIWFSSVFSTEPTTKYHI